MPALRWEQTTIKYLGVAIYRTTVLRFEGELWYGPNRAAKSGYLLDYTSLGVRLDSNLKDGCIAELSPFVCGFPGGTSLEIL